MSSRLIPVPPATTSNRAACTVLRWVGWFDWWSSSTIATVVFAQVHRGQRRFADGALFHAEHIAGGARDRGVM